MAQHIKSVVTSGLPLVTRAQFYAQMQPGDLVFCWGSPLVSKGIEDFTHGPSHVLKVWLPWSTGPWLTFEAEFGKGVRFGKFDDYMNYPGDIVLCRRSLTIEQIEAELAYGATLLDEAYDTIEFFSIIARDICSKLPLIQPDHQLFCSGAQQAVGKKSIPFDIPDHPWANPEQLYTEASVVAICGLLESK